VTKSHRRAAALALARVVLILAARVVMVVPVSTAVAVQGVLPLVVQGVLPLVVQGGLPLVVQGVLPLVVQGVLPLVVQGESRLAVQGVAVRVSARRLPRCPYTRQLEKSITSRQTPPVVGTVPRLTPGPSPTLCLRQAAWPRATHCCFTAACIEATIPVVFKGRRALPSS